MIDKNRFGKIVDFVIDNLEGGYYHPDMLKDGRVKDQRYSNSGETMFGIDRMAGAYLAKTPAGQKFWSIIDNKNARKDWKWNYKGGDVAPELKDLTGQIIYPEYERMSNRYLTPEAKKAVEADDRLAFNFVYAVWNGEGWFKKFANKINDSIANGVTNNDKLVKIAVDTRKENSNSLISQGGSKIETIINQLKGITSMELNTAKKHPIIVLLLLAGLGGIIYFSINSDKFFKK